MTIETSTTDPLKAAAAIVHGYAADAPPGTPDWRLCVAYAGLFDYAAAAPTIPDMRLFDLIVRCAEGVVELETGDAPMTPRPVVPADAIDQAVDIMVTNASVSRAGGPPKELAESIVALLRHVRSARGLGDHLVGLVRRFAAAVVAVDAAAPAELAIEQQQLGPGEFPIGVHLDGTIAAGKVPGYAELAAGGKSTSAILRNLVEQLDDQADDIRQGCALARAVGITVPEGSTRFRLRTGPLDPAHVDVYDEQGERCAIITERRDGTEWRVVAFSLAGNATSLDTVSFVRAVEHLDRFLAEQ